MHTNEDRLFMLLSHDKVHRRPHSLDHIVRTLASLNSQTGITLLPFAEHVVIIFVFLGRDTVAFLRPPADLI